jgi:hypothetical protein
MFMDTNLLWASYSIYDFSAFLETLNHLRFFYYIFESVVVVIF